MALGANRNPHKRRMCMKSAITAKRDIEEKHPPPLRGTAPLKNKKIL